MSETDFASPLKQLLTATKEKIRNKRENSANQLLVGEWLEELDAEKCKICLRKMQAVW